jgi:hypothetical protein
LAQWIGVDVCLFCLLVCLIVCSICFPGVFHLMVSDGGLKIHAHTISFLLGRHETTHTRTPGTKKWKFDRGFVTDIVVKCDAYIRPACGSAPSAVRECRKRTLKSPLTSLHLF